MFFWEIEYSVGHDVVDPDLSFKRKVARQWLYVQAADPLSAIKLFWATVGETADASEVLLRGVKYASK